MSRDTLLEGMIRKIVQKEIQAERKHLATQIRQINKRFETISDSYGYPVDGPQDTYTMLQDLADALDPVDPESDLRTLVR